MKINLRGMKKFRNFAKTIKPQTEMKKVLLSIGLIAFVATMAGCAQGPAAEGMAVAKKACECQKLSEDDTKSVEYEACLKEWDEMNNTAHEKYENDETKLKEFIEGLESYKCD